MKLLMVDDEVLALQGILDGLDWDSLDFDEVLAANSYSEALTILHKKPCDILLCDIEMPYGTGMDLVEWVKKNHPETECIFLTCHDEFAFARTAVSLGCLDYVLKPVAPEELQAVLGRAIQVVMDKRRDTQYREYGRLLVENLDSQPVYQAKTKGPDSEEAVRKAEQYLRENIAEPLSIDHIAAQVHLNPDYFARLFKKTYGKTVAQYITELRFFLANELLENGSLSVNEISGRVGYPDSSYFIRLYKKHFGITPQQYRRQAGRSE